MMKRALLSLSLITIFTSAATSALASGPVAKVNGKAIPANRAEVIIATQVAQGQAKTPEMEAQVREILIRQEVVAQEALKKGTDKKSDVQAQMDIARQSVLINAYISEYARGVKIPDADVKAEYDKINAALGSKEFKARHILVESEGEAKDLIARLKKGEKFEDLAKASKDPGSKDRGGELGWSNKASYVPPFSDALAKLEKGKYTEQPVQTQFGWHVIQLDDTRDMKAPAFEDVKPQIIQRLRQQAVDKHVAALRAKAKIE
jgi:peptidyl-prolyl cis-trans isomerase C